MFFALFSFELFFTTPTNRRWQGRGDEPLILLVNPNTVVAPPTAPPLPTQIQRRGDTVKAI